MKHNKLLTIREVAEQLRITEQEVIDLAESGKVPAYKIGGVYLRFRAEHIQEAKVSVVKATHQEERPRLGERIREFLYFNDFYILAVMITAIMLIVILRV